MASAYRLTWCDAVLQFLLPLPEGTRYALWTTGDRPTKVVDYGDDAPRRPRRCERVVPQGGNTLLDALVEASRDLKQPRGASARPSWS